MGPLLSLPFTLFLSFDFYLSSPFYFAFRLSPYPTPIWHFIRKANAHVALYRSIRVLVGTPLFNLYLVLHSDGFIQCFICSKGNKNPGVKMARIWVTRTVDMRSIRWRAWFSLHSLHFVLYPSRIYNSIGPKEYKYSGGYCYHLALPP